MLSIPGGSGWLCKEWMGPAKAGGRMDGAKGLRVSLLVQRAKWRILSSVCSNEGFTSLLGIHRLILESGLAVQENVI